MCTPVMVQEIGNSEFDVLVFHAGLLIYNTTILLERVYSGIIQNSKLQQLSLRSHCSKYNRVAPWPVLGLVLCWSFNSFTRYQERTL